ncbi:VHS domain-containing protein [Senna tora]|uniref:VHS domain-containing protein n=1 Tax=Senna tora TaxID=362788 RepID=A0A834T2S7_9FABA|nr:VHS domain-containing protein [Senna tora]
MSKVSGLLFPGRLIAFSTCLSLTVIPEKRSSACSLLSLVWNDTSAKGSSSFFCSLLVTTDPFKSPNKSSTRGVGGVKFARQHSNTSTLSLRRILRINSRAVWPVCT